jgi:hypothetical protein
MLSGRSASVCLCVRPSVGSQATRPPNRRWVSEKIAFSLSFWIVLCQLAG